MAIVGLSLILCIAHLDYLFDLVMHSLPFKRPICGMDAKSSMPDVFRQYTTSNGLSCVVLFLDEL